MRGFMMSFQKKDRMTTHSFNGLKTTNVSGRFAAAILAAMFIFTLFFVVLETCHDCSGKDCPVCACLIQCESLFRFFALFLPEPGSWQRNPLFLPFPVILVPVVLMRETLVSEKNRLDN